jgi:glycosyltransferase involved in cell wall biosynthesis
MSENKPLVSVITPVYNGEQYLAEAIESVLAQTYRPIEIIVIDDGSTDNSAGIISGFRGKVHYIYQVNRGPAAARNAGLAGARGEFISFLDADDLWPADKLQIQIPRLIENPRLDIIQGRIKYILPPEAGKVNVKFEGPENTIISVMLGSGVYRRSVFDKVGMFDETLRYSEDLDWFLRVKEHGIPLIILGEITLYCRLHSHSMTYNKTLIDFQTLKVLKKSLDRRRGQENGPPRQLLQWSDFDEVKTSRRTDPQRGS